MPYSSNSELPAYVKKLPEARQSQWRHVFNSCMEDNGTEAKCFRMANGVVKRKEADWSLGDDGDQAEVASDVEVAEAEKSYQYVESYEYESRKLSAREANYNAVGGGAEKACSNCMFFVSPARCAVVAGDIAPNGLSDLWRAVPSDNPQPIPVVIVGDEWVSESKLVRSEMPASSFAYIDSQGGRHLPIHDRAHVRNALARFNQTKFESSAAKRRARAKILAAAKRFGVEVSDGAKEGLASRLAELFGASEAPLTIAGLAPGARVTDGFAVVKQADGRLRWFARYSNSWLDRDGEIITEAAHKEYVNWAYDTGTFPELWLWHTPNTRFGEADWLDFSDGFAHASGLIDNGRESVVDALASKDVGVSHGFLSLQAGKYIQRYRSYEVSVLPREYAAVATTGFNVLEAKEADMAFTGERRKWLVDALGEEVVAGLEKNTESTAEQLKELGVEYKEAEAATEAATEAQSEGFKALAEQVAALTTTVGQLAGVVAGQQKALAEVKKTDDEKIEDAFLARVAKAFGQNGGVTRPTESKANVEGATKEADPAAVQTDFFSTMIAEQFRNVAPPSAGVGTPAVGTVSVDTSAAAAVNDGPQEVRGN